MDVFFYFLGLFVLSSSVLYLLVFYGRFMDRK